MLAALALAGSWYFARNMYEVRIIPATRAQAAAILGPDLAWTPRPPSKPTISLAEIAHITGVSRLSAWQIRVARNDAEILQYEQEIALTRATTDRIERAIAGKEPAPPTVVTSNRLEGPNQIPMAYASEFLFALAKHDQVAAVDRYLELVQWDRFVQSGEGIGDLTFLRYYDLIPLISTVEEATDRKILSAQAWRTMYEEIGASPRLDPALIRIVKSRAYAESLRIADMSESKLRKAVSVPYSGVEFPVGELDAPSTLNLLAGLTREAIANAALPWRDQKWPLASGLYRRRSAIPVYPAKLKKTTGFAKWWADFSYRRQMKAIPNVLGLAMIPQSSPRDAAVSDSFFGHCQREICRMKMALMIFKLTYHRYPSSLRELSILRLHGPEPFDPYCDGPFHYDPSRGVFWSLGVNGRDDHGVDNRAVGADDLVTTLP